MLMVRTVGSMPASMWMRQHPSAPNAVAIRRPGWKRSTAQRSNGTPVWNQHRQLAANLVGALEQVGGRVAAFGFNSRGHRHVRFLLVKDFDHRFDAAAIRRLSTMAPSGFTRLGAAIRHATHVVSEHAGTQNRLIVVVSDGFAYDDGYQGRYAEADTRHALDEAVAAGVGCLCISICSDTRQDVLDRLWGSVSHVQLEDASELSKHVVPMIQSALKSAQGAIRKIASPLDAQAFKPPATVERQRS